MLARRSPHWLLAALALALVAGWFGLAGILESGRQVRAGSPDSVARPTGSEAIALEAASDDPLAPGPTTANPLTAKRKAAPEAPAEPLAALVVNAGFRADAVYGTVLDDEGAPLEGVDVRVFEEARDLEDAALLAELVTDADGRFRHAPVPPLESLQLLLEHPEKVPDATSHFSGVDGEFELQPGASVGGRVLDGTSGLGLAGATVQLRRTHWDGEQLTDVTQVTTDAEGRYQFSGAPLGGTLRLTATVEGRRPVEEAFRVVEGGREDCDFEFGGTSVVAGTVFDLATGESVADAEFTLQGVTVAQSGEDGHFAFEQPADESEAYWLRVHAPGYCETRVKWSSEIALAGAFRVPLLRGARVEGSVLDEAGAPCDDLLLGLSARNRKVDSTRYPLYPSALSLQFRNSVEARTAVTDAAGSYAFDGILPGGREARVYLRDRERGYAEPVGAPVPTPGGTSVADLTLETTGSVRGVVQLDGEPTVARVQWTGDDRRGNARANDGGEFLLLGVAPGEVRVHATPLDKGRARGGEDPAALAAVPVQVSAGEEAWVELELDDPTEPISGTVVDPQEVPVAGVEIYAWAHDEAAGTYAQAEGTSDAEGSFSLSVTPMSTNYDLFADSGARTAQLSDVAPGTTGLELVLSDSGTLALRVTDALSKDVLEGWQLYVRAEGKETFRNRRARGGTVPDPEGFVEFELSSGSYELCIVSRSLGHRDERVHSVTVPRSGGRVEARAELRSGTDVVVELVPGKEGWELPRGEVFLLAEGQEKPRSRWSNDMGRVIWQYQEISPSRGGEPGRARGLAPGTYRIATRRGGTVFEPAVVEVPQVDEHHVRVVYRPEAEKDASSSPGANGATDVGASSVLIVPGGF